MTHKTYQQEILHWQSTKEESLRRENSWLALAGLFWLKPGENRIGSASENEIVLPPRAPSSLGTFFLDGRQVSLRVNEGNVVHVNGESSPRGLVLDTDRAQQPSFITLDGIRMVVIERPNGMGIRMWDNQRAERRVFPPREWFPINEAFVFPATYVRYAQPPKALLPNIFGQDEEWSMDGQITFEFEGAPQTLDVTEEEEGRVLFIQFRDLTSADKTYPPGRYIRTEVTRDGKLTLDFNMAYNPPCVFTPYATCAFAPAQNHLKFAVEAGELYKPH